jgi:Tetratricopeptide repeat
MCADHAAPPLQFKFYWLNDEGQQIGVLRKKGSFDGETLVLDDVEIPAAVMTDVQFRDNRLVVSTVDVNGKPAYLAVLLSGGIAARLKGDLDHARSSTWAELHKKELAEKGRANAYREERCPHCDTMLILTDMPKTPQLYCHYCDTLTTLGGYEEPPAGEKDLRVCQECGMYAKPTRFMTFYFVFLLVVYWVSHGKTWRCPPCMRKEAWKMFFGNLLFLVGVPVAIVQLIRSYGGSSPGGAFKGLDTANLKARNGDVLGALEIYQSILGRVPHSAGLKYNIGLALLQQNELERAAESFRLSLEDCSNYVPAYHVLRALYEDLDEQDKLKELKRIWEDEEPEKPAEIQEFH